MIWFETETWDVSVVENDCYTCTKQSEICILQIRLDLQESLYYRIVSNSSQSVCVCSNEAMSVRFNIVPKKLREIPLTVIAKDVNSSVCDEGVEQMALGVTDAVTRKLLVEVHVWIVSERKGLVLYVPDMGDKVTIK